MLLGLILTLWFFGPPNLLRGRISAACIRYRPLRVLLRLLLSFSGISNALDSDVAADSNLGDAAGGLVIDNATLRTTADMSSARAVELAGTQGFIETLGGTSLTLSGTVSGAGSLVKEGAGTPVLSGTNSYTGSTFVQAGTLVGNIASIRGDLTNNGVTVFDQASNGTFAGKVEGSGLVIKQGAGQLTLSGDSIARWQVDDGRLTSAAERFTGDVAIGAAGTMNFKSDRQC